MQKFLQETTGRKYSFTKLNTAICTAPDPEVRMMKYAYALAIRYPDEPLRLNVLRKRFF